MSNSPKKFLKVSYSPPQNQKEKSLEKEEKNNVIFVGGLSHRVHERDIDDVFGKFGKINKIELKVGFAFVEFKDINDADEAIYELNGTELDNSKIRVEFSRYPRNFNRNPMRSHNRVFVDGLPFNLSWQELKDYMRKAGEVLYADILRDGEGRSKGCGIVEFRQSEDMKRAIRKLNDTNLGGNFIVVKEDDQRRVINYRNNRFNYRRFGGSGYGRRYQGEYHPNHRFVKKYSPYGGRRDYRRRSISPQGDKYSSSSSSSRRRYESPRYERSPPRYSSPIMKRDYSPKFSRNDTIYKENGSNLVQYPSSGGGGGGIDQIRHDQKQYSSLRNDQKQYSGGINQMRNSPKQSK